MKNKAFTLAEVLITLVIVGVVSALTIPVLIAKYQEQQTVSRVKKVYSTVSQLIQKFQFENACTQDFAYCFEAGDSYQTSQFYKRFEKGLNIVEKIYPNEDIKHVKWLPESCKTLSGNTCPRVWYGVWKPTSGNRLTYYLLSDGTIFAITMPDESRQGGFIFFDTNGKKKPNYVGKDQFVIGIGAKNNKEYKNKVHPFYNEDDHATFQGLCNINDNHKCDPDVCTKSSCSPTAYVLKYNKLPQINW